MNLTSLFSFNGTTKEYIEKVKEYFEKQEPPRLNQIDYSYEDPKLDNIYETDSLIKLSLMRIFRLNVFGLFQYWL